MKKTLLIASIFCFYIKHSAQNLFPYKFSEQIETEFSADVKESKFQKAAWQYCEIGNYVKAKTKLEEATNFKYTELSGADSLKIKQYSYFNAKPIIIKKAKDKKLVIINEDHTDPKHRVFTESLLADMYLNGFRYLALEALEQSDKQLNTRKFPIIKSGYYAKEPQMGNLIRTALKIGFKLVAYESEKHNSPKEREINQAKNIAKLFKKDTAAKVIVHCGHDHLFENDYADWEKTMAGRLKEYTGIDPLTINQVKYTEKSKRDISDPVLKKIIILEPSVMIDDKGAFFTTLDDSKQWDISVFHPFTKYINGRPSWLTIGVNKIIKKVPTKPNELTYPFLVLAYLEKEFKNKEAVPVDVVEVQNENDKKALGLYLGNYQLVMLDITGKKMAQTVKVE
jgi:hypothetical protein